MAIYKTPPLSGTRVYRTRKVFKNLRHTTNITFGEVVPIFSKFCLPGDIWKPKLNAFIRYMPTLAPILTECNAYFRFFFVPLRQVEDDTESVITGSKNGKTLSSVPKFKNIIKEWLDIHGSPSGAADHCAIHKYSFPAMLGVRPTPYKEVSGTNYYYNYDAEVSDPDFQAAYWYKAYCKIIWEYFRDENYQSFDGDFEKFYEFMLCGKGNSDVLNNGWWFDNNAYRYLQSDMSLANYYGVDNFKLWFANLNKDYFSSTLPWIMKGVTPTITNSISGYTAWSADAFASGTYIGEQQAFGLGVISDPDSADYQKLTVMRPGSQPDSYNTYGNVTNLAQNREMRFALVDNEIHGSTSGFSAQDIRDMFAETRVFERLARCGSRYVEYLESNFGIAPRDDTLQRPLYLGGFSQPIVTTEVVQTGQGGDDPVGTMRGHGISSGGNSIRPFVCTEFGMIFCLMYVKPKTQYLYQMKREYSYKSRFDFFNPSFQLLSEQQVQSLEFFTPALQHDSSETGQDLVKFKPINRFVLGYQGMYNELRYDQDLITRDMADDLSYWTQAINPATNNAGYEQEVTPPLNGQNISIGAYLYSLLRPFHGRNGAFKPMIVDVGLGGSVFRPMVRDPIPSLVDHN